MANASILRRVRNHEFSPSTFFGVRGCIAAFIFFLILAGVAILHERETGKSAPPRVKEMKAAMHPRTPRNHAVDTTQKPWLAAGANDTAIISTSKSSALATHLRDTTDPLKNGWPTEAFSDAAAAQIVQLATLLSHPKSITTDQATRIVSPDFTCTSLRPASLEEVFRDSAIVVRRASDSNSTSAGSPGKATNGVTHYVGPAGLVQALPSLVQPFREANPVRVKLKIVGIAMQPTLATTTALFELSATFQGRTVQQNAVWQCRWRLIPNEAPQLLSIIAEDYEESVVRSPQSTLFADCTLAVLGHNRSFREQLLLGLPHWLPRIELRHAMNTFARYGGAVGDVNGDGLEDLYVCQPGGLPIDCSFRTTTEQPRMDPRKPESTFWIARRVRCSWIWTMTVTRI
jgi:hypothetical protein